MTGSKPRGATRFMLGIAALVGVAACGDAGTTDTRGYTKAPLEDPGIFIVAEPTTEMDALGEPIRPPIVELPTPAAAAPAPAPAPQS